MYLQILEQIKLKISTGDWLPGQPMPSIRQLAVDLRISVITVRRAYQDLEREGVIVTRHGKGSFVADNIEPIIDRAQEELDEQLARLIQLAESLGLSPSELRHRLKEAYKRKETP